MKQQATLICDMQFGSTGKGLIAGYLAERDKPDTVVTAWAANAGHTYINSDGRKFVHTMLANGIVSPNLKRVMIGAGSLLNFDNLEREIRDCADLLNGLDFEAVYIHEHAAIIRQKHIDEEEQSMVGIGSTSKGVGAALMEKIKRDPAGRAVAKHLLDEEHRNGYMVEGVAVRVISHADYVHILKNKAVRIQIEGAQGYSIGMNSGFYPYVTSRECTPRQIMVDCCIPHYLKPKIVGCLRTFPIRVANRFDDSGEMIGYSGNGYPDQEEISFGQIGVEPELTTVTQRPRRIFTWSDKQFLEAFDMVAPHEIFLNFVNYIDSKHDFVNLFNRVNPTFLGFGATATDIVDVGGLPLSKAVDVFNVSKQPDEDFE